MTRERYELGLLQWANCCEDRLPSPGEAQDGKVYACPVCGWKWRHLCDEAEGCCWEVERIRTQTKAESGGA